jgi:hypothetical protein
MEHPAFEGITGHAPSKLGEGFAQQDSGVGWRWSNLQLIFNKRSAPACQEPFDLAKCKKAL